MYGYMYSVYVTTTIIIIISFCVAIRIEVINFIVQLYMYELKKSGLSIVSATN